jgi:murein DD-endopeptidase MepM/ murein hydrolase activator NlpD
MAVHKFTSSARGGRNLLHGCSMFPAWCVRSATVPRAVTMVVIALAAISTPVAGDSRGLASDRRASESGVSPGRPAYRAPLEAELRVLTGFHAPVDRYAAGHRGVDLAAAQSAPVRSAATGTVVFTGAVAGRGVVVVLHPDGISTEYEPVTSAVRSGQPLVVGQLLGAVHGRHPSCAPASCLHWGARRKETYLDPMALLRPLGLVRLLPWAGGQHFPPD